MILGMMLMLVLQLGPGLTFWYANGDPTFCKPDWYNNFFYIRDWFG